jgi:hypothetical protein
MMNDLEVRKAAVCQSLERSVGRGFDHDDELYVYARLATQRTDQPQYGVSAVVGRDDNADLWLDGQWQPLIAGMGKL